MQEQLLDNCSPLCLRERWRRLRTPADTHLLAMKFVGARDETRKTQAQRCIRRAQLRRRAVKRAHGLIEKVRTLYAIPCKVPSHSIRLCCISTSSVARTSDGDIDGNVCPGVRILRHSSCSVNTRAGLASSMPPTRVAPSPGGENAHSSLDDRKVLHAHQNVAGAPRAPDPP